MANDPRERGVELMFHGRKEEWSSKMGFWEGVLGGGFGRMVMAYVKKVLLRSSECSIPPLRPSLIL